METLTVSIISWYSTIISCYMADIIGPTGYGVPEVQPQTISYSHLCQLREKRFLRTAVLFLSPEISMRHLSCKKFLQKE